MHRFDVIIPYRPVTEDRERIWEWIHERWTRSFPEANIIVCDSGDEVFSRSRSRNQGAMLAETDVFVCADADTVPMRAFLLGAVEVAEQDAWCIGYGPFDYYNLNAEETERYLSLSPMCEVRRPQINEYDFKLKSWAGMIAVPRSAFEQIGGYDERFVGWGHEDVAFRLKLDNEFGNHARIADGYTVHFHHTREEAQFDTAVEKANRELFEREYRRKYRWRDERHG